MIFFTSFKKISCIFSLSYAEIVLSMQDEKGRWLKRAGGRIIDAGKNGQPNKWITLSALRVVKAISE